MAPRPFRKRHGRNYRNTKTGAHRAENAAELTAFKNDPGLQSRAFAWILVRRAWSKGKETAGKTKGSMKPVMMHPALAEYLTEWRNDSP